jgi:predicted permease
MTRLIEDLAYAARRLLKNPSFTLVALATLALGIGANAAIFTVVDAVVLQPLAFAAPERLVKVFVDNPGANLANASASPLDIEDWQRRSRAFAAIGGYSTNGGDLALTGRGEPENLATAYVTPGFFAALEAPVGLGRTLLPSDSRPGGNRVVVISYGLWQRRFGAEPRVVGSTLTLDAAPFTVVGVLRSGAGFPTADVEIWAPASVVGEKAIPRLRQLRWMKAIARLAPGVSVEQARAELESRARALAQDYPESNKGWTQARLIPLQAWMIGDARRPLLVLLAVVAMVLLIACANLANLLLAQASARGREIAIRTALGAARSRIVRQLLTESLLLSLAGGALGLLAAAWTVKSLVALSAGSLPRVQEIAVDERVLIFTLMLSLLTGVVFGLAPAWKLSRLGGSDGLKEKAGTASRGRHRFQQLLVIAEIALAMMLVIGAGLTARSLWNLFRVDPGLDPRNTLVATFSVPASRYPERGQVRAFVREIEQRLATQPGFVAVGGIQYLPLTGRGGERDTLTVVGEPAPAGEEPIATFHPISGEYFRAMGIRLLRGRAFDLHDDAEAPPVAIVNRTLAHRYFGARDPIGRAVRSGDSPPMRIVGMVGDVKSLGLAAATEPEVYVPFEQRMRLRMSLVARTRTEPLQLVGQLGATLHEVDKFLPISAVRTMADVLAESTARRRFLALLLAGFSLLALVLAAVGIYGVTSFLANQRLQEIGVRMALGATPGDILRRIVGEGLGITLLGVLLGLVATSALAQLLASQLFGLSPRDAATYVAVAAVLVLVAALASYLPARRAAATDPVAVLRQE